MNGFSEQDFGVLARVLDSLTAMVNLKNHYDVYSAVEHAFRVCLEEEAQFAKLIGDEPNSWITAQRFQSIRVFLCTHPDEDHPSSRLRV